MSTNAPAKKQASNIVYTSERKQMDQRGLRARVKMYRPVAWRKNSDPDIEAWGWKVVVVEAGKTVYVSMGLPEHGPKKHYECWVCEYASAELLNRGGLCDACRETANAVRAIRLQLECGVNLGYRNPTFNDERGFHGGSSTMDVGPRGLDMRSMRVISNRVASSKPQPIPTRAKKKSHEYDCFGIHRDNTVDASY